MAPNYWLNTIRKLISLAKQGDSEGPAFTLFAKLPHEIRLQIWEAALPPPYQDHTGYNIWSSDCGQLSNQRLPKQQKAPSGLLGACSESRAIALAHGSFLHIARSAFGTPPSGHEGLWINNNVKTLMIPVNTSAFAELSVIPQTIECIAGLWPHPNWMGSMLPLLNSTRHHHNIRTVFHGIAWIPLGYSQGSNIENHPCVDSDTAVVPLNDPRMLDYLISAFECHALKTMEEDIEQIIFQKSAKRFLAYHKYRARERQRELERYHIVHNGLEVKPAIIFGRPHRSEDYWLVHSILSIDTFLYRTEVDEEFETWEELQDLPPVSHLFQGWGLILRHALITRALIEQ